MEEVLKGTGDEIGSSVETSDDEFGYRWMIVQDPDLEDLAVGINAVTDALAVGGYNERVLCAVFAFEDQAKQPIYFIYNYKRGAWYPFVPARGGKQRNSERELQIKAPGRAGPADRGRARALVPAVGDSDLGRVAACGRLARRLAVSAAYRERPHRGSGGAGVGGAPPGRRWRPHADPGPIRGSGEDSLRNQRANPPRTPSNAGSGRIDRDIRGKSSSHDARPKRTPATPEPTLPSPRRPHPPRRAQATRLRRAGTPSTATRRRPAP